MNTVLLNLASFIYLIPLFLGLSKFPFLSNREKRFFAFIVASAICSTLAYFTRTVGNNVYVLYLFTILEIIFVPIFLLDKDDKIKFKLPWAIGVGLGIGLVLFEAFIREGGVSKWNNLSLTLTALSLSVLSIRNLLKLRYDSSIYDLSKSPIFWFTLGLGIYYLGNILIFSFTRLFQEQNLQVLTNLVYFRFSLIYISATMYIWGFVIIKAKTDTGTLIGKPK